MFHIELRQFPNVARTFNLSEDELHARIVGPWVAERPLELDDRRWSPDRARLTIYEGPRLPPEEMGLGRGWANVARSGRDVTAEVLGRARRAGGADDAREQFKAELEGLATTGPLTLAQVLSLAAARNPGRRVSEHVALAEQSVWELLHQHRIVISRGGTEVPEGAWQPLLLSLETWTREASEIALRPPRP